MPVIRPSSDLRNKYNEISQFCHDNNEPVYITKNGHGDLAVMSIDTYERILGKFELDKLLEESYLAIKNEEIYSFNDVASELLNDSDD